MIGKLTLSSARQATLQIKKKKWKLSLPFLLTLPYLILSTLFLIFPLIAVFAVSFQDGFQAWIRVIENKVYWEALKGSLLLAAWTSIEASIAGAALALVWSKRLHKHGWFLAFLNFAAHNGGISLAFALLATLGTNGMLTLLLKAVGIHLYPDFELVSLGGLHWAYLSFMVPFMTLIFLPAAGALRKEWNDAAKTLGASFSQYARRVAGPVLLPAYVSSTALVFLQALGTYATAQAIADNRINLLPTQIGYLLQMSVFSQSDANALSFLLLLIMVIVVIVYRSANKKASRWLQ